MITSRQISLGIEEDRVFLGHNIEFVVKGVITDLFHIVPIGDDIVFVGYLRVKNATFLTYVDYDALAKWVGKEGQYERDVLRTTAFSLFRLALYSVY